MTFQRQVTVRINDVYNLVTNKKFKIIGPVGRIMTLLLKSPITKVVIKVNMKRYRFMQL
jgi:hypothetical protein